MEFLHRIILIIRKVAKLNILLNQSTLIFNCLIFHFFSTSIYDLIKIVQIFFKKKKISKILFMNILKIIINKFKYLQYFMLYFIIVNCWNEFEWRDKYICNKFPITKKKKKWGKKVAQRIWMIKLIAEEIHFLRYFISC